MTRKADHAQPGTDFRVGQESNSQGKYGGKFVLPALGDFLIFAQVGANLVDPSTGKFLNGEVARKSWSDPELFWTSIGASPQRSPRKVGGRVPQQLRPFQCDWGMPGNGQRSQTPRSACRLAVPASE